MALPFPIALSQVIAKAPVDEYLMTSIKYNLEYLDSQIASAGGVTFNWNINGKITRLDKFKKALDTSVNYSDFAPQAMRAVLKRSGISGTLKFDLRKLATPKTPIIEVAHQYAAATQSIARAASAINTQSIARTIAQVSTQSISYAKGAGSITSIINVGGNLWRYNLGATVLDSDWRVGEYVIVSGASNANNNGTFEIVEVNQSNYGDVVVNNASGVAQTSSGGTVNLLLMSYNYANPMDADYVPGEKASFGGHTGASNNGLFDIYKVNEGGNNLWVYNQTGVLQAGVAGNVNVERWIYSYASPVSTEHYSIGETALMASHSTASNNGNKAIVDLNRGGNNIVIANTLAGAVQGGAAGNASPNRFVYAMPTNPSSQVQVGDSFSMEGHTNPANNGIFNIVFVNIGASNNLIIHNVDGVAQGGAAGNARSSRKLLKFTADQSSVYTTDSFIEIEGVQASGDYNNIRTIGQHEVLEVNRGGGANFNVVISVPGGQSQTNEAGHITTEAKSIFTVLPEIPISKTGNSADKILKFHSTNIVAGDIEATTPVLLYLLEVPEGAEDLSVILF